jgi:hypothetical protein
MLIPLLLLLGQVSEPTRLPIDQVRDDSDRFIGYKIVLCGEVNPDLSVIYSDTIQHIHGRVGFRLRGYKIAGRNQCVTGYLVHDDSEKPPVRNKPRDILVTDSAVQPNYVFVASNSSLR